MTNALREITPLEERAVRRFEHDRQFHLRCYARAKQLEGIRQESEPLDYAGDLSRRLQDAMRELQAEDEAIHDDDSIVRGARYIGDELLGIFYATASVPEQEALKAATRRVLAAVENKQ
ncbi:conserved hypothetical protein (plasmid) [Pseudarthrobacter chlorophenolicus A6]|uniref:Uncharacterized protein n=1 Tax=Pseudarthrobacter chlorophenolicus (strain ATCC 700700 / DSM 12829 / CIP 107037 / JCM 12360 / KCTC 9906 / NCIMB 13794 / A6) TaxID=452863 RepID=B8HIH7_PSECP|nr:hypothetical protein [Pseudarthrobacter chlorophenolicus]ACL42224.1 conserved hypothetical protein [Pseudarthrobacter chlorophenolicus A6]SDQ15121.1 hypothetical protein SAMN04489738_0331 [Pseudarthrobacter chlorophenolicus]